MGTFTTCRGLPVSFTNGSTRCSMRYPDGAVVVLLLLCWCWYWCCCCWCWWCCAVGAVGAVLLVLCCWCWWCWWLLVGARAGLLRACVSGLSPALLVGAAASQHSLRSPERKPGQNWTGLDKSPQYEYLFLMTFLLFWGDLSPFISRLQLLPVKSLSSFV